jgi:hypothetical protein
MGQAEEPVVPILIGEPLEQRVQSLDVGLRHGSHGQGPATGQTDGVKNAISSVNARFSVI